MIFTFQHPVYGPIEVTCQVSNHHENDQKKWSVEIESIKLEDGTIFAHTVIESDLYHELTDAAHKELYYLGA